jgi:hypothetical protein
LPEHPVADLTRAIVPLIYTGNPATAWKLLDMAWPPGEKGKQRYRRDFTKRLRSSDYLKGLVWPDGSLGRRRADTPWDLAKTAGRYLRTIYGSIQ